MKHVIERHMCIHPWGKKRARGESLPPLSRSAAAPYILSCFASLIPRDGHTTAAFPEL